LLRVRYRLGRVLNSIFGTSRQVEMTGFQGFYEKLWREAAESLAADFTEIAEGLWEVRRDNRATWIRNYVVQRDDPVILDLAGDKALCYRLLRQQYLPVPGHAVFRLHELTTARAFLARHSDARFVVKPSTGTAGARGITLHVRTFRECVRAAVLASLYCKDILIERFIPGEAYRLLVLDGRLIHATRRRGLRVTGDGHATIRQLLDKEYRGHDIRMDDSDCLDTLAAQARSWDTIPAAGRELLVRSSPLPAAQRTEARTVFDEDATDLLCREIVQSAEQAARILHSRFAGVDILTVDPSAPLDRTGGVINEINTTPGLHHHYNLRNSAGAGPAPLVLKHLLEMSHSGEGQ
jgi:cyanophycin synthetase